VNRLRQLIVSIRDGDEDHIEEAILQFSRRSRMFAPLALLVGAFVMLFSGLRLLVTNWRLMLVQALPAMLIWAVTLDLKAHVLRGKQFQLIHGPIVLVIFAGAIAATIAAFYLNAAFAFAISRPGPPELGAGFREARSHATVIGSWGALAGVALAVAAVLAPRWGLGWFTVLLGIVLALMMICYVAVPARIVGVRMAKATSGQSRRDKLTGAAVIGAFGAIVCAPAYLLARSGLVLLGSHRLFWLGIALLVIGLILQAGATGAVKAVKVSAKLIVGKPAHAPDDRPASTLGS
jgi:hypothetical protein